MEGERLAELIRDAQRGDQAAFGRLVDVFAGRLFGFLLRVTGSHSDAEDLLQEVFVRLVRMIASYRHQDRFEAWIFRIAANLARDRARHAARTPRGLAIKGHGEAGDLSCSPDPLDSLSGSGDAADDRMIRREERDALAEALEKLPAAEREVIMLRHFSELSFKEIAEITDTPLGTALARAHRGLGKLRELMTTKECVNPPARRPSGMRST